jgi:hypothetical protein
MSIEAMKLALEALESFVSPDNCEHGFWWEKCPNPECEKVKDMKAITALRQAIEAYPKTDKTDGFLHTELTGYLLPLRDEEK